MRLAYRTANQAIEVAGWVRNMTDVQYRVDSFDVTAQFQTVVEVWGEPRTFGMTVSYMY